LFGTNVFRFSLGPLPGPLCFARTILVYTSVIWYLCYKQLRFNFAG
jgi:hypothetical protein